MGAEDPHARLEKAVKGWASGDLPGDLPQRWERFSDVAIIPHDSFKGPDWEVDRRLWEAVAEALGAKRLARMGEVSGERRESGEPSAAPPLGPLWPFQRCSPFAWAHHAALRSQFTRGDGRWLSLFRMVVRRSSR